MRRLPTPRSWPLLVGALLLVVLPSSLAATITGRVVGVADGDTITVLVDRRPVRVRLWGIDCPEKRQAFGSRAKQATSALTFGKQDRTPCKCPT